MKDGGVIMVLIGSIILVAMFAKLFPSILGTVSGNHLLLIQYGLISMVVLALVAVAISTMGGK